MLRLNLAGFLLAAMLVCLGDRQAHAAGLQAGLQKAVVSAMAGRRGAVVILDVPSGHILASYHLDVAARRVVHPGSSIKPFSLLALLQADKMDQRTTLMCKRSVSIAGHRLDCTHPATQTLGPAEALAYSCNSYFTSVALRLTPAQLRDSLAADGFTSPTTLAANEAAGSVTLAQSTEQLQLQAIGEWGIDVTPLELVHAYRDLALLQTKHNQKLVPLFDGLQQSASYGMARLAQPAGTVKVAGKTGTAAAEEGPWTHAWFAGYAPAEKPEIALVVFLESGHGGSEASRVAREVFIAFDAARTSNGAKLTGGAQP